jgi:stage III sporulation protein AE
VKKKWKKQTTAYLYAMAIWLSLFLGLPVVCYAQALEEEEMKRTEEVQEADSIDGLLSLLDLDELEQMTTEAGLGEVSFSELYEMLLDGTIDYATLAKKLLHMVISSAGSELRLTWTVSCRLLALAAAAAILYRFGDAFSKNETGQMGFFVVYLLMSALLLETFGVIAESVSDTVMWMIRFMRVLAPIYSVLIICTTGSVSAAAFYQLTMGLLYGLEAGFHYVLLPAVRVFLVVTLCDRLLKERLFRHFCDMIHSGIEWGRKAAVALVVGLNLVQGILSPAVDSLRSSTLTRTVRAIPGVSGVFDSVTEVLIGSGIVLKNAVGISAVLILLAVSIAPCIKVWLAAVLLKATAAILEPVSDERICGSIFAAGEGVKMMGKIMLTMEALFFLALAIITVSTNGMHR